MKKTKELIKTIIKTKRFLYLTIILIIILFGVTLNIALGIFSNNRVNEFINTKVSNITYYLSINGYPSLILEIEANKEKSFDLNIKSLETFDTKYEVIYNLCTDSTCSSYIENLDGLEMFYSSLSIDEVSGIIAADSSKSIRLVIKNNSEDNQYIKLGINSGFVHNTLDMKNLIVNEYEDNFLVSNILSQYGGLSNIKEPALDIFSAINNEKENNLYKTIDDYGYSYYYRGAEDYLNNNLIFAGMKWKIVRINGDESIKLIYNSKCLDELCETFNEDIITSSYNLNYDDNKYVGYMYGELSDNRENSVKNEIESVIKKALGSWYETNLLGNEYETYLANTLFCNDRRIQSEVGSEEISLGFGKENTIYAGNYRLNINKTPNLKCGTLNDQFLISEELPLIKYPVGLLTADEASFAGLIYNTDNSTNYLKTNYDWWTLSPYSFEEETSKVMYITSNGSLSNNNVNSLFGVRPITNLKDDVKISGTGSISDPYIIIK
ncbi:MAG: DUF6273 domain-containing protein [Bacilli bacterium]|nr:DUF6273 domain-containing protein [Bacilli bacterium]MDD4406532.1 DUF6273 domain-containing protein [Bacilli bacterium]